MLDENTGTVYPCYAWWGQEEQHKLEKHINMIEDYILWNYEGKNPDIPELYLFSLRTSLRRWPLLPADFAFLPIRDFNHDGKGIHIEPHKDGNYLIVIVKIDGKIRSDGHEAFVEAIDYVRMFLPPSQRVTMMSYEYEPGDATTGYKESSKAQVVFAVTKSSVPSLVLTSSSDGGTELHTDKAARELQHLTPRTLDPFKILFEMDLRKELRSPTLVSAS